MLQAIDRKVVFFNFRNIYFYQLPLLVEEFPTGHFVNLPITYKSKKLNTKLLKNYFKKKIHFNDD